MTHALSRYAQVEDLTRYPALTAAVDRAFHLDRPQHDMRRWEYTLALAAQVRWHTHSHAARPQGPVIDVGGAGSPFWRMANPNTCRVIDPEVNYTLAEHLTRGPILAAEVYCLSVIEHIPPAELDRFCYHLSCLTAPGGLLFLTCDAVDHAVTGDTYHFHWMRQRIFDRPALLQLRAAFVERYHFTDLAGVDYHYPGPTVYDYSFASLALVKRS